MMSEKIKGTLYLALASAIMTPLMLGFIWGACSFIVWEIIPLDIGVFLELWRGTGLFLFVFFAPIFWIYDRGR